MSPSSHDPRVTLYGVLPSYSPDLRQSSVGVVRLGLGRYIVIASATLDRESALLCLPEDTLALFSSLPRHRESLPTLP